MIITKTPFRISFVGGGSDLESFYSQYIGAVFSTTINRYMYISSHNFFDIDKIRLKYSKTETVDDVSKIEHPIVKEVLKKFSINGALEISSNADVPAGTGVGSSSSFTVGLLHNLYTRSNLFVTKEKLAEEACDIEINKLKEPIGKQDQYAAAFGGLNIIKFNPEGTVNVEIIHLSSEIYQSLQENLIIFYTGMQRATSEILTEQKANMTSRNKSDILREMVSLVWDVRDALYGNDLERFGKILHHNWLLKQQLASKISNSDIDDLYAIGLKNGAVGGKLLGAGGGGFLLFYCDKEKQNKLREAMKGLQELKFRFESEGSKVIYIGDE
ncbi:MAG: GHMP kinase [Spirochaetes bacterium]|nr:GHMP kinase [Spirochaetota bacterium]